MTPHNGHQLSLSYTAPLQSQQINRHDHLDPRHQSTPETKKRRNSLPTELLALREENPHNLISSQHKLATFPDERISVSCPNVVYLHFPMYISKTL
jgi:hypothetical protein